MIAHCTCQHSYQDSKYGKGKRVFNEKSNSGATCTVCGSAYKGSAPEKKVDNKGKKK